MFPRMNGNSMTFAQIGANVQRRETQSEVVSIGPMVQSIGSLRYSTFQFT